MQEVKNLNLPKLQACQNGGLCFFSDVELFEQHGVRVAFTTRQGGVSEGDFEGLNLGFHVNDDASAVKQNIALLLQAAGAPEHTKPVRLNQVHGVDILNLANFKSADELQQINQSQVGFDTRALQNAQVPLGDFDAIIARGGTLAPILCFADCVPLIMVAPDATFSVAHAGWRGVIGEIAVRTLVELAKSAACDPQAINIYIGSYIHKECFEVSADLHQKFAQKYGEGVVSDLQNESSCYTVDLGEALRVQLIGAGAIKERICDLDICTVCNSDAFYSYRASGGRCGRHGAVAFARRATN
jgi:hypothetical protein